MLAMRSCTIASACRSPPHSPANGSLNLKLTIDQNIDVKSGALQISLVQEGVFWAHDIGLVPPTIPLN